MLELRRADVDLDAGVIRVRRTACVVNGAWVVGTPKSKEGSRDVTVPPHLMPMITDHLANHVGPEKDSLLFPATRNGGHLRQSTAFWHFDKARKAAGRPDLRFHDLRHTGLTLAAQEGASLAELKARAGHSSVEAALIYQHATRGRDHELAARLSKLAENG